MKVCKKCSQVKGVLDFPVYKTLDSVEYRRSECIQCYRSRQLEWSSQNPNAKKRAYVARTWGMTLEEYEDLLSGGCEVCGTLEGLAIDHDHDCCPIAKGSCGNCIRGVLCSRHNLAEGNLRGDPNEAYALAEYMKKHWKGELL